MTSTQSKNAHIKKSQIEEKENKIVNPSEIDLVDKKLKKITNYNRIKRTESHFKEIFHKDEGASEESDF